MRSIKVILAILLSIAMLFACTGCGEKEVTEYVIGFVGPLTGASAQDGQDALEGAQLYVEQVNAAGGIDGIPLTLNVQDDKGDPKEAAIVANMLAQDESVLAIVGHYNSSCTLAGAPIYNEAGVAAIAYGSSSPAVTEAGPYIYRTIPSDDVGGRMVAQWAFADLSPTKAAIVYENNDYGLGAYEVAVEVLGEAGITPLVAEAYLLGETKDFSTIITKMKDAGVEAVFAVSDETELPMFMKQSHQLGFNPFVTSTGTYNNVVVELGGQDVEGLYGATFFDPSNPPEKIAAFFKKVSERFADEGATEEDVNALTLSAYAATQMMIEGLKQNGASREGVKNYLTGLQDFETPMGPISFDENGDTVIPLTRMVIENGTFVFAD